ncbi:MAG: CBS domain-containing protein, partial [Clostridiales bacterium]|nr:CBS domain-containing protein [Clostridiales bacterium]
MNILFFLTPKSDVAFLYEDFTLRQALEKMEHRKYSAIPVLNREGEYVDTITEGDILWEVVRKHDFNMAKAEKVPLTEIKRRMRVEPVSIDVKIEDLMLKSMEQNFVP